MSLLDWYHSHGRKNLPWRQDASPYHIYISEIMLQQTQVKTVLDRYYFPFLETFPTLQDIANAPIEKVLKAWEGLGYYTRARNLHKAALTCSGKLPSTPEELLALSGIGQNTAHAILAFGHHQPYPLLEANIKRIIARLYALENPSEKELWQRAWDLLDTQYSFDYNQAMMDLGALVCTPKIPDCSHCPYTLTCRGKENPLLYPTPKIKKKVPTKKLYALVLKQEEKFGLIVRKEKLLGGLWGFTQRLEKPKDAQEVGRVTHTYSHFKLELTVLTCKDKTGTDGWFSPEEIKSLALSRVDLKILQLLEKDNYENI